MKTAAPYIYCLTSFTYLAACSRATLYTTSVETRSSIPERRMRSSCFDQVTCHMTDDQRNRKWAAIGNVAYVESEELANYCLFY